MARQIERLAEAVRWQVQFAEEFTPEFLALPLNVRLAVLASTGVLERFGPSLGRPHVDTLKGSRHSNLKELRFTADGGVWKIAFAFEPRRNAILLVAGDKSGVNQERFYRDLIRTAESRFTKHLLQLGL